MGAIYLSSWKTGKIFKCLFEGHEAEEGDDETHAIESIDMKNSWEKGWLVSGSMDGHLKCYERMKGMKWSDI